MTDKADLPNDSEPFGTNLNPLGGCSLLTAPVYEGTSVPSLRLDFLRGAAALYVVFGHARGHLFAGGSTLASTGELGWFDYLMLAILQSTSLGTEAVMLFFVLSGFAMAHSFSRSESLTSFYQKRAWRIWPPYLAAVALAFCFAAVVLRSSQANAVTDAIRNSQWGVAEALQMMFYIQVDTELTAQFWSLPQEVMFYLLCPLLLSTKSRVLMFLSFSIILTGGGIWVNGVYSDPTVGGGVVYRHFCTLLVFFMVGASAYHYQDLIPNISGRILLFFFIASFVGIWYVKYIVLDGWNILSSLMTVPLALVLIKNVPAELYKKGWLNWGRFSYSLYLVHMQVIVLIGYILARAGDIEQAQMTSYWLWSLAVPPVVGFSWLFYQFTEKRCDAVLTKIRQREKELAKATRAAVVR